MTRNFMAFLVIAIMAVATSVALLTARQDEPTQTVNTAAKADRLDAGKGAGR